MEKMPFRDSEAVMDVQTVMSAEVTTETNWRQTLPVLAGSMVTLRELRLSDAPSLLAMLATEEVGRFISPPPTTVDGFERFIAWTHRERAAGAPRSGARACSSTARRWSSTSHSTSSARTASRRGRPSRTDAATVRCGKSARCRRESSGSRSFATVNIWTRPCGRFSTRTGAVRSRSGVRGFIKP